ncbi:MAG: DEAD/DEAH box helicase [Polyangiales bacterium]
MSFEFEQLIDPLRRALRDSGYETPTSIQVQGIPPVLERRDVLGCAQTGTGKTAAFALPILQRLHAGGVRAERGLPAVLVLAPTRELAAQIDENFRGYGQYLDVRSTVVFGGVGYDKQIRALRDGVHVLVATPGRLKDLLERHAVELSRVRVLVLDEADRMLDMGFIHDVRRIVALLPAERQNLLFSATMPKEIQHLADEILNDPVRIAVTPVATTAETVKQAIYPVDKAQKRALLVHLFKNPNLTRAIVFSRTKHGANRVAEYLEKAGVAAAAIHGNKSQGARERALAGFKSGRLRALVATDIAARGIDVDGISHVINFDLPNEPESYVHRIGRTGRAGAEGVAWSFCDHEERAYLRDIERIIRQELEVVLDHPYVPSDAATLRTKLSAPPSRGGGQGRPSNPQRRRGGGFGGGSSGGGGGGRGPRRGGPRRER